MKLFQLLDTFSLDIDNIQNWKLKKKKKGLQIAEIKLPFSK